MSSPWRSPPFQAQQKHRVHPEMPAGTSPPCQPQEMQRFSMAVLALSCSPAALAALPAAILLPWLNTGRKRRFLLFTASWLQVRGTSLLGIVIISLWHRPAGRQVLCLLIIDHYIKLHIPAWETTHGSLVTRRSLYILHQHSPEENGCSGGLQKTSSLPFLPSWSPENPTASGTCEG